MHQPDLFYDNMEKYRIIGCLSILMFGILQVSSKDFSEEDDMGGKRKDGFRFVVWTKPSSDEAEDEQQLCNEIQWSCRTAESSSKLLL